ncbi:MAG: hypothetical protein MJ086_04260 [Lachnospiraceae bacterium]|nr:hypothetical protein [Lachnospiraceae bacterium]
MQNYKYDGSTKFNIKNFDCGDTGEFKERHEAIQEFVANLDEINDYQQKLFAEQKEGIIFVFQAMDAAGKDGAVRAVLSCLSPQGVSEHSFKTPTAEEKAHDYLWRFWKALPEKGHISILNRSYYEDVLVQKVHKIYESYKWADRIDMDEIIDNRYKQIRNFESYLWENSFRVVKIFLNVSKDEQARRFISRIDTPKKNWKFSSSDIDERAYWDDYMKAFEVCINETARENTPWYIVPADHKWYARLVISRIILDELKKMDPDWPVLPEEEMEQLATYRAQLVLETELDNIVVDEATKGFRVKPADTAIANAINADSEALKKKKFQKYLKQSAFEIFKNTYGVDEEHLEVLGSVYLNYEEQETAAEMENAATITQYYNEKKKELKDDIEGLGKEGKKLYDKFKDEAKEFTADYEIRTNELYKKYSECLTRSIERFEKEIAGRSRNLDGSLKKFGSDVKRHFTNHRKKANRLALEVMADLEETYGTYKAAITEMVLAKEAAIAEKAELPEEISETEEE